MLKEALLIRFGDNVADQGMHVLILVLKFFFSFIFKATYLCPVLYDQSLASFCGQRDQSSQVDHPYCAQHYLLWLLED